MINDNVLYVGNLSPLVNEEVLLEMFGQIGSCKIDKIVNDVNNSNINYAFVEFDDVAKANEAIKLMNKRICLGQEMQVNNKSINSSNEVSGQYHVFVGDLDSNVDIEQLKQAFKSYGEIINAKIIKHAETSESKGFGFVTFKYQNDAEMAISGMNGQLIGKRKIRTNWAQFKNRSENNYKHRLDFNKVWNKTSDTNTTVYFSGINNLTQDYVKNIFASYGSISSINVFSNRNYAFISFIDKQSACNAICCVHNMQIDGFKAKCSWAKEHNTTVNYQQQCNSLAANQISPQPQADSYNWYGYPSTFTSYPQYYNEPIWSQTTNYKTAPYYNKYKLMKKS